MRIALVAMSGIRGCDPDLLALGLRLPGFAGRWQALAALPSLGLLTLAGLTPKRHEQRYFEVRDLPPGAEPFSSFDLVAISTLGAQAGEACALARRVRDAGVPVVVGGLHATAVPDEMLAHADAVVVGEGEDVWPQVLEDAEHGRLGGIYRAPGPFDLSRAPMPAFHLLPDARPPRFTVQASRGCPHRCDFCASSVAFATGYRQKPMGLLLAEIDAIRARWQRPFLELADDNALVRREHWLELLPELARRRVRWFAETDLSIADHDDLLRRLRASGCVELLIGLESPVEPPLRGIELVSDWKRRRSAGALEAVRRIQSHGIAVNGCFVLGLDGQGLEALDAIEELALEAGLFDVQVTVLTPFPGTPLEARLRSHGRLLFDGRRERLTLFDVNFVPDRMSVEELERGFRELVVRLYGEDGTRRRRARFRELARRGAATMGRSST